MGKGFGDGGKSGGKGKAGEPKKPVTRSARAGLQVQQYKQSSSRVTSGATLMPHAAHGDIPWVSIPIRDRALHSLSSSQKSLLLLLDSCTREREPPARSSSSRPANDGKTG